MKRIFSRLFNTRAAGIYFIVFAAAIGIATFIENDFGTSAAQKLIYKAWWFELLLLLFGGSIVYNIIQYRMVQQRKWSLLLFHSSILIILLGAALTRYIGFEGVMHIRENTSSSTFLSADTHLLFEVSKEGNIYEFSEPVLFASLGNNSFSETYLVDGDLIEIKVTDFLANPEQILESSESGKPTLKLVIAGTGGREEYYLEQGQTRRIRDLIINFSERSITGAINIEYLNGSLNLNANRELVRTVMATQQIDTLAPGDEKQPLILKALYSDGINSFVFSEFDPSAQVKTVSTDPKVRGESISAVELEITANGRTETIYVYGNKGLPGNPVSLNFDGFKLNAAYGAKEMTVPFSIQLNEFIMERYPGTNSASSYASEVTLFDGDKNVQLDYRIYMNNILNYGGYRFFQSSFDRDEQGTYLSVNSDFWGTIVSYLGYALLTLGMIWTLLSKNTRFYDVRKKIQKLRAKTGTFCLVLGVLIAGNVQAQKAEHVKNAVSLEHADAFSKVVVQDFKGRMKPVHTLSREILRKVSRKESWDGLSADQVILSMFVNKRDWYDVKLIKLGKHPDVQKLLGLSSEYASYKDFFSEDGSYKFRDEVRRIYAMEPKERGVYAKELVKIDERLNIVSMVFSGSLLKVIPNPDTPNQTWEGYSGHSHDDGHNHSVVATNFFNSYGLALKEATQTRDFNHVGHLLAELKTYQVAKGGDIMPSKTKINTEISLNNLNVFSRLAGWYMLLALLLLVFLFVSVFKPQWNLKLIYKILFGLVVAGFVFHTIGLGMRWYVSGRAPWSNGYESMIYIAWTSTLAGILFTRRSFGGLAATMVLAGTILFVSMLSFLDPEITPLVPVLKSYWLTIHVSLEAGSYGFLMLGAIIGLINLILLIFISEANKSRVKRIVQEMSYISELTLIGGLFMISVGTYLGGVWANESWGRYWGWDAKETWALVTILVYAFILHMRFIPKLRGVYAYNLATIFGLASVIMTYYGVNYYLSGLHSYATGDPVPIPQWVYIAVAVIILISITAYFRKKRVWK